MLRFISPLRVPGTKSGRLYSYCFTARIFCSGAAAYHPKGASEYKNESSLNARCRSFRSPGLPSTLEDPDEEASSLDRHQLVELFSGTFPADFSGEVIHIPTTRNQYHALVDAFGQMRPEHKKQRVFMDFKEKLSMTSVTLEESAVHATVVGSVSDALRRGIDIPREFQIWGNTSVGEDISSPDLQLVYEPPGDGPLATIFAVEVGFSQDSEDLKERVNQLFLETPVKVCVMVDIKEAPKYKSPFARDKDIKYKKAKYKETTNKKETQRKTNLEIYQSQSRITTLQDSFRYQDEDDKLSPILIYGVQWVGTLTGVIQVFAKDPATGEVVEKMDKMQFYGTRELLAWQLEERRENRERKIMKHEDYEGGLDEGERVCAEEKMPIFEAYPKLNVKMADFMPLNDDIYQQELTVDWDALRLGLHMARKRLAQARCKAAVKKLEKDGLA